MSFTPNSDRSQTLMGILFMALFALAILIFVMAKDISNFVCGFESLKEVCSNRTALQASSGYDPLIESQITTACVDTNGLKLSVLFNAPVSGDVGVQVFTTGEDVFPSEQGMEDSYTTSMKIPETSNTMDFAIPVETMPVGEQIFGNIVTSDEQGISSHLSFFVEVSDCAETDAGIPDPGLVTSSQDIPIGYNVTCLSNKKMMIAFEFDRPVFGQYQILVSGIPFQLASVGNQPVVLFFSGEPPLERTATIRLISAFNQDVLFEGAHTLPACSPE